MLDQARVAGNVIYWIDWRDDIVGVNDEWTAFALANDAPDLARDLVLRQPLWRFIADETTRQLYEDMLRRVRAGKTIRFPLRCDSPAERRRLEMTVVADQDETVRFESVLVSAEARPRQVLWERSIARSARNLRVCGWCKRLDVGGEWQEAEDALAPLAIFEHHQPPGLTHGICERCVDTMLRR